MPEKKSKPVGRPPKFETVQQMEKLIKRYFKKCDGKILKDKTGSIILDKNGQPIVINRKIPTVTGLALALGFTNRQSLLNYQAKEEFLDTITRAKGIIEMHNEEMLYDKNTCNGAKFSLENNFKWSEKKIIDANLKPKKLEDMLGNEDEEQI